MPVDEVGGHEFARRAGLIVQKLKPSPLQRWFDGLSIGMSSPEGPVLLVSTRVTGREHGLGAVTWLSSSSTAFVSASSSEGERR